MSHRILSFSIFRNNQIKITNKLIAKRAILTLKNQIYKVSN